MKRLIALCLSAGLIVLGCGGGAAPGGSPAATIKVGMVTDIGQLEDKSFNEFSWKGVQEGAKTIGAATPKVVVTKDIADYKQNIQSLVDEKFNVIVTVGFLIGTDTLKAAQANPNVQFFGVDQFFADPVPANVQGLLFAEAQAGYLAGILAANITKSNKIGAVGGRSDVPPVVDYITGYKNAAMKEKPGITVSVNYTEDFNAPTRARPPRKR